MQETTGANAVDAGALAVDRTYTNTPTLGEDGPFPNFSSAVDFDNAADEHVLIGDVVGSDIGADFTVAVWYRTDSGDVAEIPQTIFQLHTEGASDETMTVGVNRGVGAPVDQVPYLQYLTGGAGPAEWESIHAWNFRGLDDEWTFAAFKVEFATKRITAIINGIEYHTEIADDWDQARSTGVMKLRIGGDVKSSDYSFDGRIAHALIFPTLLPNGRIKALYAAKISTMVSEVFDVRMANILAAIEWGGGSLLSDRSTTALTAITDTDSTVLAQLRRAAQSEGGSVLVGKDGRILGRDRHWQSLESGVSSFAFDTNFIDFSGEADNDRLFNVVSLTTAADELVRAENQDSKDQFGRDRDQWPLFRTESAEKFSPPKLPKMRIKF